ncbi:hypothetical protein GBAR_LOCUS19587 [Geodia barretti]|uniref:Uncharacterized protein n=1 Tax=Geodia barretti TaxID=519541 RepID=A0AA35X1Z3_GEOBA|nr:hypothetical protein GBAR_LOCUS19587 [Geodia barretti]
MGEVPAADETLTPDDAADVLESRSYYLHRPSPTSWGSSSNCRNTSWKPSTPRTLRLINTFLEF